MSGVELDLYWALWCCTARTESPPLKRHRTEETSDDTSSHEDEVSDVICGEIARLHHRFVVSVDPSRHPGSKVINLLCRLGKCVRPDTCVGHRCQILALVFHADAWLLTSLTAFGAQRQSMTLEVFHRSTGHRLSRSVLFCHIHLPPAVPLTDCPQLFLESSFSGNFCSSYFVYFLIFCGLPVATVKFTLLKMLSSPLHIVETLVEYNETRQDCF